MCKHEEQKVGKNNGRLMPRGRQAVTREHLDGVMRPLVHIIMFVSHTTILQGQDHYPHCPDKESEAQRGPSRGSNPSLWQQRPHPLPVALLKAGAREGAGGQGSTMMAGGKQE